MVRRGLFVAVGATLGLCFAFLDVRDDAPRSSRTAGSPLAGSSRPSQDADPSPGVTQSSQPTADEWKDWNRRPLFVDAERAKRLPDVPGLEAWRDGRDRQRRLYSVVQPPDKRALHRQWRWVACLQCFGNQPDSHERKARIQRLEQALAKATHPVARQNLIFLAAVTLPHEDARRLLEPVMDGDDSGDREDALGALAFSGDAGALQRYQTGPREAAAVHRLADRPDVLDALVPQDPHGARKILRSYRLIETLDRDLYFDFQTLDAPHDWLPPPDPSDAMAERLLREWLNRYPGHPGGDDMAWRLAWIDVRRGDFLGAARWFSKSSTMPDRRVKNQSSSQMLRDCAEFLLDLGQIDTLLHDEGLDTPNRQWLQWILVRRTAAERSVDQGLKLAAAMASSEPRSAVGKAWRWRWFFDPPRGLDSGIAPLPADDPLRQVGDGGVTSRAALGGIADDLKTGRVSSRLEPARESRPLAWERAAVQFRVWETLAELEARARRVRGPAAADLRYKRGAVLYHAAGSAFLPTYRPGRSGHHYGAESFRSQLTRKQQAALTRRFVETSFGPLRAIAIWRRLEDSAPDYTGLDKAIYSQGLAYRKLLDYELAPVYSLTDHPAMVRGLVDAFERLAHRFPKSPLATPGAAAARYWRRRAPKLFR